LRPNADMQLSRFMHWLTMTHTQRWHRAHGTTGSGALYQGRYKALPVQYETYFLTLAKYVQRNPVRAGLCAQVEQWRWSSAWQGRNADEFCQLDPWPLPRPGDWLELMNESVCERDVAIVREAITRSAPLGNKNWTEEMAGRLGIRLCPRRPGRPRNGGHQANDKIAPDPVTNT